MKFWVYSCKQISRWMRVWLAGIRESRRRRQLSKFFPAKWLIPRLISLHEWIPGVLIDESARFGEVWSFVAVSRRKSGEGSSEMVTGGQITIWSPNLLKGYGVNPEVYKFSIQSPNSLQSLHSEPWSFKSFQKHFIYLF